MPSGSWDPRACMGAWSRSWVLRVRCGGFRGEERRMAWVSTSGPIRYQLPWSWPCSGTCHLGGHWKYAHSLESTPVVEQGSDVKKPTHLDTLTSRRIFMLFRDRCYKGLIIFFKKMIAPLLGSTPGQSQTSESPAFEEFSPGLG